MPRQLGPGGTQLPRHMGPPGPKMGGDPHACDTGTGSSAGTYIDIVTVGSMKSISNSPQFIDPFFCCCTGKRCILSTLSSEVF